ncbi:(2Fe-2S) ferredoxin domain-containing protein [Micromonospora sp. NBC_00389]|uniref:(2Fe-2S) ferredoxin domain-containing protein n=1 Tax=Micromonospora sp. NBC_00389 TaxID=2903586 RepID=UPI002E208353
MSRRAGQAKLAATPCTVTVCRGCCCGNTTVTPGFDHAGQLAQLHGELAGTATVRVSDCLDMCSHANVMVVSPGGAGRAAGARPVWLGLLTDPEATEDLVTWIRAGGPGVADPTPVLDLHFVTARHKARQAFDR